jgi:hypothetical protein
MRMQARPFLAMQYVHAIAFAAQAGGQPGGQSHLRLAAFACSASRSSLSDFANRVRRLLLIQSLQGRSCFIRFHVF